LLFDCQSDRIFKPAAFIHISAAADSLSEITELYRDKFSRLPAGKRIFIQTVQQINGWRDLPQSFSARIPTQ
jgi:hypothetical protein